MTSRRIPPSETHPLFADLPVPVKKRRSRKESGIPLGLELGKYEFDENDSLLREIVGPWVRDKHLVLERYVGITAGVRKNWVAKSFSKGTTYIDLFSGPGRVKIKNTNDVLAGSPLVAWETSVKKKTGFSKVFVADAHPAIINACKQRLEAVSAPVCWEAGEATVSVDQVFKHLHKSAFHFAFLDPFKLSPLSFEIIRKLAAAKSIDILIHVSIHDMNRNLREYMSQTPSPFDTFAPGWRKKVSVNGDDTLIRSQIFDHWKYLLSTIDMRLADAVELVSGTNNQPLYWLAFASRHPLAHEFWEKIRTPTVEQRVLLLGN